MNRPNIIFYFADQQRADTCGCYGQKLDVTPNLDKLAAQGTVFEHAYTCQPVCGPARACLQSGSYATQNGCYRNALALPLDIPTLANCFNDAGYETAYIGKWHLATTKPTYSTVDPNEPNYETTAIPPEYRGGYRDYWMASDVLEFTSHGYNGYVFDGNMKKHEFIGYRADCINNYAIEYLHQKTSDKPFFMFISQIEPHHQNDRGVFEGPDGSKERFADFEVPGDLLPGQGDWEKSYPDYLGQCHSLDENVGRLVDSLKEKGIWDQTILIYSSDHGSHFCTRNAEYKRSCHDASIRIPMIAVGGAFNGGGHVKDIVSLIDVPATLLDCAGIKAPDTFSGHSFMQVVEGKEWLQKEAFLQISESQVGRAIRTERYTYSVRADADGWWDREAQTYYEEFLYDNEKDPHQHNNLAEAPEMEGVRTELKERLIQRMMEIGEEKPTILPWSMRPDSMK